MTEKELKDQHFEFYIQIFKALGVFYSPKEALERFNKILEFLENYDYNKNK